MEGSERLDRKTDHYVTYICPMVDTLVYLANNHPDAIEALGDHEIWHLEELPLDHTKKEGEMLHHALEILKALRRAADSGAEDATDRQGKLERLEAEYGNTLYGID